MAREALRGVAAARDAADLLVKRLTKEVDALKSQVAVAEQAIDVILGDDEVAVRVRALLPALTALVAGRPPSWIDRIRRNVALHAEAEGIDLVKASGREL